MGSMHPGNTRQHSGTPQEFARWVLDHGGDVLDIHEDGTVVVISTWGPQRVAPGDWITTMNGPWERYGPRMIGEALRAGAAPWRAGLR